MDIPCRALVPIFAPLKVETPVQPPPSSSFSFPLSDPPPPLKSPPLSLRNPLLSLPNTPSRSPINLTKGLLKSLLLLHLAPIQRGSSYPQITTKYHATKAGGTSSRGPLKPKASGTSSHSRRTSEKRPRERSSPTETRVPSAKKVRRPMHKATLHVSSSSAMDSDDPLFEPTIEQVTPVASPAPSAPTPSSGFKTRKVVPGKVLDSRS